MSDLEVGEMPDDVLLCRLHDAIGLVRYYESAESEWVNEREVRRQAGRDYAILLHEAQERGLNWQAIYTDDV